MLIGRPLAAESVTVNDMVPADSSSPASAIEIEGG